MSQQGFRLLTCAAAVVFLSAVDAPAQCTPYTDQIDLSALPATGKGFVIGFPPYTSVCGLSPVSSAQWVRVTYLATASIGVVVDPNPYPAKRVATITHTGGSLTIGQVGRTNCTYVFSPEDPVTVPVDGSTGTVTLNTDCGWTAASDSWITVSPPSGVPPVSGPYYYGRASFVLQYRVAANPSMTARTGSIRIGDRSLTIIQPALSCMPDVSPGNTTIPAEGGDGMFSLSVNKLCSWSALPSATWIQTSSNGSGDGKVSFTVSPNVPGSQRTSSIVVNGRSFVVTQQGLTCSTQVTPTRVAVDAAGGSAVLSLTANSQLCPWEAASDASWIGTGATTRGKGNAKVTLTVTANPGPDPRTGTAKIAGQSIEVTQTGAVPAVSITAIRHAATRQSGAVAPGTLVAIQGQGIGPVADVRSDWTQDGKLPVLAGGTRATFNGVAAPLVSAGPKEVVAVVPYGIPEGGSAQVVVEHGDVASAPVAIEVRPAAPGIFTADGTGAGAALAFHPDGQANSRTLPAPRGSVVVIFATGAGRLQPDVDDGSKGNGTSTPRLPVAVTIGGVPARIVYAGDMPGAVSGMLQVNVEVPAEAAPGDAEVILRIGEWTSPSGTTLSVGGEATP